MKPRVLIYGGIALALVVLWAFLVYTPYRHKAASARAAVRDTERRIDEAHRLTLQLPAFLKAEQTAESLRLDLDARLYAHADVLALVDDLVARADRHRLRVAEITPPVEELLQLDRTAAAASPPFLNLEITVTGEFEQLGRFVADVEGSDYARGINRCIIAGAPDGSAPLSLQLGLRALLGSRGGSA
ncbi:MAG TPA: hypothetical protein PK186_05770 [candidate division Zixibacteria bacterium]|nr:hypothetical protein [candidate division Zixibacteria bacterium]MDD4918609.1 hypothetical protein [candidate division Zixibacteria bacterium]MDM7974308.1 hypothetical protein [candidate division Zixibacteria bacterium]HOD66278.1 hypothetical protein [candidate division Zixibacteria bacterium]HPM37048.1 hypothetical protein [candidate division Zixibacteria bacterium]